MSRIQVDCAGSLVGQMFLKTKFTQSSWKSKSSKSLKSLACNCWLVKAHRSVRLERSRRGVLEQLCLLCGSSPAAAARGKTTPSSHLPQTIPSWSVTGKMASGYVDPEGSDGGWSRLITTLPAGRAEICHCSCSPPSNPPWNNWSLVNDQQHSSGQTALVSA